MSQEALMQFQQIVFFDAQMQAALREITDRDEFIKRVVQTAAAHDLEFTDEDVLTALQTSRRAWLERWL